jgi:hypothetical protein
MAGFLELALSKKNSRKIAEGVSTIWTEFNGDWVELPPTPPQSRSRINSRMRTRRLKALKACGTPD